MHQKSRSLRGSNAMEQIRPLSDRSIRRIEKEIGIETKNGETITDARMEAVSDKNNLISFAAAQHLITGLVDYRLIINADAI